MRIGLLHGVALMLLAGCASAPGASEPLDGSAWKLASADRGTLAAKAADSGITLEFSGDRITGQGGCNRYTGSYVLDGDRLKAGPVAATKMACDRMAAEQAWFAALQGELRVERRGDRLTLHGADGTVFGFERTTAGR